ncbi:hypothetical protein [Methanococcus maripaludis]|uniref:hypothetical protein n=1 Tax=Methanococcus maripaludis TaxID=39152 RepID=UPI000E6B4204|nr:hypothetical protein [Methanococcus maripaludis]
MEFNILIVIMSCIFSALIGTTKIWKLIGLVGVISVVLPFSIDSVSTAMFFINNSANVTACSEVLSTYLIDSVYLLLNLTVPSWIGLILGVSFSEKIGTGEI